MTPRARGFLLTTSPSSSAPSRTLLVAVALSVLFVAGVCQMGEGALEGLLQQHGHHGDGRRADASAYLAQRRPEINNLALSGGGVYGVTHVGVLSVLEQQPCYHLKSVAGTSIGAFYGSLISAGYTSAQLAGAVAPTAAPVRNATLIGETMLSVFGMKDGSEIQVPLDTLLYYKTGIFGVTFAQLAAASGVKFTAVAYNLNKRELEYFNNETTPNMKVSLGVQLSSSVPVLYSSNVYNGHRYIDGGVRAVNPAEYFGDDKRNTILSSFEPHYDATSIVNVEDYASQLLLVMQENNLPRLNTQSWMKRTIASPMPAGIRDTQITVSLAQAQAMYNSGVSTATAFFASPSSPFC